MHRAPVAAITIRCRVGSAASHCSTAPGIDTLASSEVSGTSRQKWQSGPELDCVERTEAFGDCWQQSELAEMLEHPGLSYASAKLDATSAAIEATTMPVFMLGSEASFR